MLSVSESANSIANINRTKVGYSLIKLFILGILAGLFISLAAFSASVASCTIENASVSKLINACIFPSGLIMILLAGGELFTGNCLISISVLDHQIKVRSMLKNWVVVYLGNFVGALLFALIINVSGLLSLFDNALTVAVIKTAILKSSFPFGQAMLLGILCNFLVCIAVWVSYTSKSISGKVLGVFFPVMLFVLCGFEHSIANMYYIPVGLFALKFHNVAISTLGSNITILTWTNFFVNNLIPVTLGNIIGGVGLVSIPYWFIYLKKPHV